MSITRGPGIGVIDIFAGPGGLGEGFSGFRVGSRAPFTMGVSAEMEPSAHATLRLRAFYRLLSAAEGPMPAAYATYLEHLAHDGKGLPEVFFENAGLADIWRQADSEALNLTLGRREDNEHLYRRIAAVRRRHDQLVLIGGPPCQAYSVVGRARQRNVRGFRTRGDHRHFLYREYLHILSRFKPDVFIMENVKGILTSKVGGLRMFEQIHADLSNPTQALDGMTTRRGRSDEYVLLPIHVEEGMKRCPEMVAADPMGFLIRCEDHGVPQARHRVIIMGVRADHASRALSVRGLIRSAPVGVKSALAGLPRLRSGLSRGADSPDKWLAAANRQQKRVMRSVGKRDHRLLQTLSELEFDRALPRSGKAYEGTPSPYSVALGHDRSVPVLNHETRTHMEDDLGRYMFCAAYGATHGCSPSSAQFPRALAPAHVNWETGAFADRFRVQLAIGRPGSTVTSHISKDGHAFIHWDATQCRSFTVREAARIQSFPDNYAFLGNKTQQYVQVGNAVPPRVATQIANVVWDILYR